MPWPDRLVKIGNRPVEIVLLSVGLSAVSERKRIFRIEPDRLVKIGNGQVELVL
jgi:hypothetical protein